MTFSKVGSARPRTARLLVSVLLFVHSAPLSATEPGCNDWSKAVFFAMLSMEDIQGCLRQGLDLTARGDNGWTMLHYAVEYSDSPGVVDMLVAAGADPNARADDGRMPLHVAGQFDEWPDATEALIAAGADPNGRDDVGRTPLHWAAGVDGSPDFVRVVVAAGASPESRDDSGWKPLHMAAGLGSSADMVAALVAAGADPNGRLASGATPLHIAAEHGNAPLVVYALVTAGADPEARDEVGWTPLHYAGAHSDSLDVIDAFDVVGADPNARDDAGQTPLHAAAVASDRWEVVAMLVAAGADPNARDDDGYTPLHAGGQFNDVAEIATALIASGADLHARATGGDTPLHTALIGAHPDVVAVLLGAGSDVNARDALGWTPLHYAGRNAKSAEVIRELIAYGADPYAREIDGWTPLAVANVFGGSTEVVGEILGYYLPDIDDSQRLTQPGLHRARCWFEQDLTWPAKECFFMVVAEDSEDAAGPLIGFPVVRFAAGADTTLNPVLHLGGGGPGMAMALAADPESIWSVYGGLVAASGRDLYVMDPRGVGMSYPGLRCPEVLDGSRTEMRQALSLAEGNELSYAAQRACRDRLAPDGHDLSSYNSRAVAADAEALRQALGVDQWVLFGGSYGSRYALTIARDFPVSVEAMVLNGAVFPNVRDMEQRARNDERLFERAFAKCDREGWCDAKSLSSRFWTLVRALDENPLVIDDLPQSVAESYEVERLVLTGWRLVAMTFNALYDADYFGELPVLLDLLERGRAAGAAFQTALLTWWEFVFDRTYSDPVFVAHFCAEEHPFVDYAAARRNAAETRLADYAASGLDWLESTCRIWDVVPADPIEGEAVRTDIPTLFLQGALDPATPMDYLPDQLGNFSRHEVLIFDDSSHWGSVYEDCAMEAVGDFIEHKHLRGRSDGCGRPHGGEP